MVHGFVRWVVSIGTFQWKLARPAFAFPLRGDLTCDQFEGHAHEAQQRDDRQAGTRREEEPDAGSPHSLRGSH
jgi:hypothetical protein